MQSHCSDYLVEFFFSIYSVIKIFIEFSDILNKQTELEKPLVHDIYKPSTPPVPAHDDRWPHNQTLLVILPQQTISLIKSDK